MTQYRVSAVLDDGVRAYVGDWTGNPPWSLTMDRKRAGFFSQRQAEELKVYGCCSGLDMEIEAVNLQHHKGMQQ